MEGVARTAEELEAAEARKNVEAGGVRRAKAAAAGSDLIEIAAAATLMADAESLTARICIARAASADEAGRALTVAEAAVEWRTEALKSSKSTRGSCAHNTIQQIKQAK